MPKLIDLTGMTFGRLKVIGLNRTSLNQKSILRWDAVCKCGTHRLVIGKNLRNGSTQSCGCKQREVAKAFAAGMNRIHGQTNSPEWNSWSSMFARCNNPKLMAFKNYGARGISICQEWSSFEVFLDDMGKRPSGHSLDRKDNTKDYEPGNCRWATPGEQSKNRRSVVMVTMDEETRCIAEWCDLLGIPRSRVYSRIYSGINPVKALITPVNQAQRRGHRDEPQVVLKLAELRAQRTAIYRGNQG
jgi:hypothetical protein